MEGQRCVCGAIVCMECVWGGAPVGRQRSVCGGIVCMECAWGVVAMECVVVGGHEVGVGVGVRGWVCAHACH